MRLSLVTVLRRQFSGLRQTMKEPADQMTAAASQILGGSAQQISRPGAPGARLIQEPRQKKLCIYAADTVVNYMSLRAADAQLFPVFEK